MIFDFRFWHYLGNQSSLHLDLQEKQMRGFYKRVWLVGLLGFLYYIARELWGMNTENLTGVYTVLGYDGYTIARLVSLVGIILWAAIYLAFHFYGVAFILHKISSIPFRQLLVLQLFVTALLLVEKGIIFAVFVFLGMTAPVSFLSFGPLAATFLGSAFWVFFFNQLSIFTAVIIAIQYRFIRAFSDIHPRMILLILIGIHLVMALLVAAFGYLPLENWYSQLVEGGAGNE
ncbi:hypothetical protein [Paenisporosarcina cavernae]|uniref:Yip1 domain-containing protein n=1 Tax=Paenisporosarcina cavernae TaxID=2320858 RepID=A0A385YT47_9BACL|nr:hypothetical protein [Paenisporosarcina cavernae]AYC28858.1 hypothetical protein D3873_02840 [Paenisporosarcina cavernae]